MSASPGALPRRAILKGALLGAAAVAVGGGLTGCTSSRRAGDAARPTASPSQAGKQPVPAATDTAAKGGRVLLAYFSRAGENYHYGGRRRLEIGNTEVLAGIISRRLGCDVHRIQAADPYPEDYDATVKRNVREQDADARPGIANPLTSIDRYDTVLLGSPIWNVRAPMIMSTSRGADACQRGSAGLRRDDRCSRCDPSAGCMYDRRRGRGVSSSIVPG